jgi:REP element-mobilizing transposase RayT
MQNKRMFIHDYTRIGFYMITIVTAGRRPLFGVCEGDCVNLSSMGEIVTRRWSEIPSHRSEIEASTLVVMPDHIHGILYVKKRLAKPMGDTIRGFKSGVTAELRKIYGDHTLEIWEESYHDRIIMNSETLCEERRYIADNPRRYSVRRSHPDLFTRATPIENARLPSGMKWFGFGNSFLLEKPDLMAVLISRSASAEEVALLKRRVLDRTARGTVIVSPFISQGEKEIATMVVERDYGSLILLKSEGFPPLYKPSRLYFDLCAKGRLLVLSPFAYTGHRKKLTRERCLRMNEWVGGICGGICGNNAATR